MKKLFALFIAMLSAFIYSMAQPEINSVNDFPDPVEVPGYNNITADITNASWRGAIGYHYITVEAYNGAGLKEKSLPVLVYIFSI